MTGNSAHFLFSAVSVFSNLKLVVPDVTCLAMDCLHTVLDIPNKCVITFVLLRVHRLLMCLLFVEDINKMWIFCKTPEYVMVFGLHYSKFSDVKL